MNIAIRVENAYSDGHESSVSETVEIDAFTDIEQLWDQLVQRTGDGHDQAGKLGYCHTVTIIGCEQRPDVVGLSREWAGV